MDRNTLTQRLKDQARLQGFPLAGVCPAVSPAGFTRLEQWLERGYGGTMHYLADRLQAYEHPRHVLDGVRSILMLAMPYRTAEPARCEAGEGRVSRYAWGQQDYHDVIHGRLRRLADWLQAEAPGARVRGVVDSAPLLERQFAQLAGLGWIGKNTLLLNKTLGSWFFLAALLTDQELDYDQTQPADHCGTCRACLDACPTDAFPQAYVLDATRCISYLTIELRDAVTTELRSGMGEWLFGCDVCQEVCPWNHRAPLADERAFEPLEDLQPAELAQLFYLDDDAFRARFRHLPLWRPRRRGLLRNAAIVLGNQPTAEATEALIRGLGDHEPLVRGACAWALARLGSPEAMDALRARRSVEMDAEVSAELEAALRLP